MNNNFFHKKVNKYQKYKSGRIELPVVKVIPVENCIKVIHVFYANSEYNWFGVNEIIRKTGSKDKATIIKAIKYLEKGQILETNNKEGGPQLTPKQLTQLGLEILDLITNIIQSNNAYLKVTQLISELDIKLCQRKDNRYDDIDLNNYRKIIETQLCKTLNTDPKYLNDFFEIFPEINLSSDDEYICDKLISSLYNTILIYDKYFFNCLFERFFLISRKYQINEIAKEIILSIIYEAISKTLSIKNKREIHDDKKFITLSEVKGYNKSIDFFSLIFDDLFSAEYRVRGNNKDSTELLLSLIKTLKPTEKEIYQKIRTKHGYSSEEESSDREERESLIFMSRVYHDSDLYKILSKYIRSNGNR